MVHQQQYIKKALQQHGSVWAWNDVWLIIIIMPFRTGHRSHDGADLLIPHERSEIFPTAPTYTTSHLVQAATILTDRSLPFETVVICGAAEVKKAPFRLLLQHQPGISSATIKDPNTGIVL
ncbi:MAG: hypothetical protein Q9210_005280 [Variospora velana]